MLALIPSAGTTVRDLRASKPEALPVGGVSLHLLFPVHAELLQTIAVRPEPVLRMLAKEPADPLLESLREGQVEVGIYLSDDPDRIGDQVVVVQVQELLR